MEQWQHLVRHSKLAPASGPLHLLVSLPRAVFFQISTRLTPSSHFRACINVSPSERLSLSALVISSSSSHCSFPYETHCSSEYGPYILYLLVYFFSVFPARWFSGKSV